MMSNTDNSTHYAATLPGEIVERDDRNAQIESKHPDYDQNLKVSTRNQDFVLGEVAVKAKSQLYLPAINQQQKNNPSTYANYLQRTNFYNSAGRSVAALHGSLFRVDPLLRYSETIDQYLDNIDLSGRSLLEFVRDVTYQYMITGNEFVYNEFSGSSVGLSMAEAESQNLRPYLVHARNADIFDFAYRVIKGERKLSMIKLYSRTQTNNRDSIVTNENITLLYLDAEGIYTQAVYTKADDDWMLTTPDFRPLVNGAPISFIPGSFVGEAFGQAIITDLVSVNEKHYRSSADLAHALLLIAIPNIKITGVTETEANAITSNGIGGQVLTSMNPDAQIDWMSFDGKGVELMQSNIQTLERQIASLGAKSLVSDTAMSESADALMIKSSGDHANLGRLSAQISKSIQRVLNIFAMFLGNGSNEITFNASQSFTSNKISHQELSALTAAWQSGAISYETLFENLQRGEVADQEKSFEEEQKAIEEQAPMVNAMETAPDEIIEVDRTTI